MNNHFAVIPADIRYNKSLTANAKLLYGEISALCYEKGFCWANNRYFAELYEVSIPTISTWISSLEKAGYIKVESNQITGNNRNIFLATPSLEKSKEGLNENLNTSLDNSNDPLKKNLKHNDTVNNTNNGTIEILAAEAALEEKQEDLTEILPLQEKPKKEKTSGQKERKASEPCHASCKQLYMNYYHDYYFEGKDGKALNQIIANIRHKLKINNKEDPDIEQINSFFEYVISHLPKWYTDTGNTTLSTLASNFEKIYSQLRNGNSQSISYKNRKDHSNHSELEAYDAELNARIRELTSTG
jgi:DNA-binding MarR family transcriptional regulator